MERLLVISPVHNEAAHIELVARALAAQTRVPDLWVVVNDRSTDGTDEILGRLENELDFMKVLSTEGLPAAPPTRDKLAAAAAPRTFNVGLRAVDWESFTHVAKLDGDTELPPDYFERLLGEFRRDSTLGLAGGVYADPDPDAGEGCWKVVPIPVEHHVPGTLKCYTLECLRAIGGVQERLAWDTIDETYARMRGFRTRAFPELVARHHRPWGTADGALRGRARHGQCAYIVHFTVPWVALRAFKVAKVPPRGLSGLAFFVGYARSALTRVPRVEDDEFRRFVHRELRARMRSEVRERTRTLRGAPRLATRER